MNLNENPHRRYNPLTDSWVLVSPHRNNRPWQGQIEKNITVSRPVYDATCYLCPTNKRSNGAINPDYPNVFAFDNDFAALNQLNAPHQSSNFNDSEKLIPVNSKLMIAKPERGICRVICFSPHHNVTIPDMEISEIRKVVDLWCQEYETLSQNKFINSVQIFENKGAIMGCSNPHPHGQIWAQESMTDEVAKKQKSQTNYYKKNKRTFLSDYVAEELKLAERIVYNNAHFVVLVPFWAVWPFETMIIPLRPMSRITEMTDAEKTALADAYKQITLRYDALFETSFPYSAGIHQAPSDGKIYPAWHWHKSFYPPLLRSAMVKKFMVGYEMFANPQRDITPEQAAHMLKQV